MTNPMAANTTPLDPSQPLLVLNPPLTKVVSPTSVTTRSTKPSLEGPTPETFAKLARGLSPLRPFEVDRH